MSKDCKSSLIRSLKTQLIIINNYNLILDSSLVGDSRTEFAMDFDRVLNNIRELNILAGEGCSDITRTKDGARLKVFNLQDAPCEKEEN